uniref:Uncharacterized protein n=1 Tax=Anopheles culicifacies TaxID=139723 RepID=A0A182LT31_9DIPT
MNPGGSRKTRKYQLSSGKSGTSRQTQRTRTIAPETVRCTSISANSIVVVIKRVLNKKRSILTRRWHSLIDAQVERSLIHGSTMPPSIKGLCVFVLLAVCLVCVSGSLLHELTVEAGELVRSCLRRTSVSRWDCVKNESLSAVHQLSDAPRIVLLDGVQLVQAEGSRSEIHSTPEESKVSEHDGAVVSTWSNSVLNALRRLLDTHVLEVDLSHRDDVQEAPATESTRTVLAVRFGGQPKRPIPLTDESEGRHRRRQQMIPMMIFGVTVFGMFIIPIAFQFLTALSGKAFLMAKLALLLASINGLKRVASAGVHYGLYHAVDQYPIPAHHPPPPFHQHPHAGPLLYDRAEGLYGEGPRRSGISPLTWATFHSETVTAVGSVAWSDGTLHFRYRMDHVFIVVWQGKEAMQRCE